MMGIAKLSCKLLSNRFFWVLGTLEATARGCNLVDRAIPNTWHHNNGVVVVYDEEGRPWIIKRSREVDLIIETFRRDFRLKRGAHVPHSSDGGEFFRMVVKDY